MRRMYTTTIIGVNFASIMKKIVRKIERMTHVHEQGVSDWFHENYIRNANDCHHFSVVFNYQQHSALAIGI